MREIFEIAAKDNVICEWVFLFVEATEDQLHPPPLSLSSFFQLEYDIVPLPPATMLVSPFLPVTLVDRNLSLRVLHLYPPHLQTWSLPSDPVDIAWMA